MWDKKALVFHEEGFQLTGLSKCQEIMETSNKTFIFPQINSAHNDIVKHFK